MEANANFQLHAGDSKDLIFFHLNSRTSMNSIHGSLWDLRTWINKLYSRGYCWILDPSSEKGIQFKGLFTSRSSKCFASTLPKNLESSSLPPHRILAPEDSAWAWGRLRHVFSSAWFVRYKPVHEAWRHTPHHCRMYSSKEKAKGSDINFQSWRWDYRCLGNLFMKGSYGSGGSTWKTLMIKGSYLTLLQW